MKLNHKRYSTAIFIACDRATGRAFHVNPLQYIDPRQLKWTSVRPEMMLQLSQHMAEDLRRRGYDEPEIHVVASASLHGRPFQFQVDPRVDLSAQRRSLMPASWIVRDIEPMPRTQVPPDREKRDEGVRSVMAWWAEQMAEKP